MNARNKLEGLLDLVAETLAEQVKATDDETGKRNCGAATLAAAIKLLKDNGITAIAAKGSPLGNLAAALPTFPSDEDGDELH